jgi:hypothetical protein
MKNTNNMLNLVKQSKKITDKNVELLFSSKINDITKYDKPFTEYFLKKVDPYVIDFSVVPIDNKKGYYVPNLKINNKSDLILLIPSLDTNTFDEIHDNIQTILEELNFDVCYIYSFDLKEIKRGEYLLKLSDQFSFHDIDIKYYKIVSINVIEINNIKNKRKRSQNNAIVENKKPNGGMISPSALWNYSHGDVLLSLLDIYTKNKNYNKVPTNLRHHVENKKEDTFLKRIFNLGNEFENYIKTIFEKKYEITQITDKAYLAHDVNLYNETINAMKKGCPIIYQGVLHNYENNTIGCCDFIIRSDYVNRILNGHILNEYEQQKGCCFNTQWHYIAIDVKFHNLVSAYSKKYHKHLTNDTGLIYPKLQLCLYTQALGYTQKFTPSKAIVIGKNNKLNNWDFGIVDFNNELNKKYLNKLSEGVEIIRNLRQNWQNIELLPQPSFDYLRPNMKSKYDCGSFKKTYANILCDPTLLYYVGPKQRDLALKHNITSYKDPKLTCSLMNINPLTKTGKRINNILFVNKQNGFCQIPNCLENNLGDWRNETKYFDVYIDFEFFNNPFSTQFFEKNKVAEFNDLIF